MAFRVCVTSAITIEFTPPVAAPRPKTRPGVHTYPRSVTTDRVVVQRWTDVRPETLREVPRRAAAAFVRTRAARE